MNRYRRSKKTKPGRKPSFGAAGIYEDELEPVKSQRHIEGTHTTIRVLVETDPENDSRWLMTADRWTLSAQKHMCEIIKGEAGLIGSPGRYQDVIVDNRAFKESNITLVKGCSKAVVPVFGRFPYVGKKRSRHPRRQITLRVVRTSRTQILVEWAKNRLRGQPFDTVARKAVFCWVPNQLLLDVVTEQRLEEGPVTFDIERQRDDEDLLSSNDQLDAKYGKDFNRVLSAWLKRNSRRRRRCSNFVVCENLEEFLFSSLCDRCRLQRKITYGTD